MIDRFVILKHGDPRPSEDRILFCDGAGGNAFREETDLELSHWRPNRTPTAFRAGTSTEICFRFLDNPAPGEWSVAVNNHLDVDGMLSVYALVRSREALARRATIIAAAEMGDFWGWGDDSAQRLFQGLTRLMNVRLEAGNSVESIYEEAFRRIPAFLAGTDADSPATEASLAPLRRGVALVEQGAIRRTPRGRRFVQYTIPLELAADALERAVHVPSFNEAISESALLWPQVRAKWDAQRVALVSVETVGGWRHDLWFPGYLWADTEGLWTVPGMQFRAGMDRYDLNNPALSRAATELEQAETATGLWTLGDGVSPFHAEFQSLFPVVLRFVNESGAPAASGLSPDVVAAKLAAPFG